MPINGFGVALLTLVLVIVPWLALKSKQAIEGRELPIARPAFFRQAIFFQLLFGGVAVLAAITGEVALPLFPALWWTWWSGGALLAAALVTLKVRWPGRTEKERRRLYSILPRGREELPPYLLLCLVASVVEEVVYRGVAYRLLLRLGLTAAMAILLLVIAFSLAHSLQGWKSVASIAIVAAAFHAVVIYSGALLPAIAAHLLYDIFAGLRIPRWIERDAIASSPVPGAG
jgi:membrane protease YdiL (CAAX protease family)